MRTETFIAIVKTSLFLHKEKREQLIANANWLKPSERKQIVLKLKKTAKNIAKLQEKEENKIQMLYQAVKEFKKTELPKILEKKEQEHETETIQKAESTLENL